MAANPAINFHEDLLMGELPLEADVGCNDGLMGQRSACDLDWSTGLAACGNDTEHCINIDHV